MQAPDNIFWILPKEIFYIIFQLLDLQSKLRFIRTNKWILSTTQRIYKDFRNDCAERCIKNDKKIRYPVFRSIILHPDPFILVWANYPKKFKTYYLDPESGIFLWELLENPDPEKFEILARKYCNTHKDFNNKICLLEIINGTMRVVGGDIFTQQKIESGSPMIDQFTDWKWYKYANSHTSIMLLYLIMFREIGENSKSHGNLISRYGYRYHKSFDSIREFYKKN